MKTPNRFLILIAGFLCASIGGAFSQDQKSDQPDKKLERPPAEKKADPPKQPEPKPPGPQTDKAPQRPSPDQVTKIREEMRKHGEEIQKLRVAGKHDEAEQKMAEVRKKFEAMREKFGGVDFGRGGPPPFGERGQGHGGPPRAENRPEPGAPDQKKPGAQNPPAKKPAAEPQKQAAKPEERKGPPHHDEARKPERHAGGPGPHTDKAPQRPSPEQVTKIREEMRKHAGEIKGLRAAGKHDEAEKKIAELRKKFEGVRQHFGIGDRDRGGPPNFGQRGPGDGRGGPPLAQKGPGHNSRDAAGRPDSPKPPVKPSPDSDKQAAKPAERKGPPQHHHGEGRPEHHGKPESRDHAESRDHDDKSKHAQNHNRPKHHGKPQSRDHGDDKSKFAQNHNRQDHSRGFRPQKGPRFAQGPGSFQRGSVGPQKMKFRMMQMKQMARAGKGPGNWGHPAPFAGKSPSGPQSKLQRFQAQRAGALKAGADRKGKVESKRSKSEKPEKGEKKRNKKASKPACAECAKAKKGS